MDSGVSEIHHNQNKMASQETKLPSWRCSPFNRRFYSEATLAVGSSDSNIFRSTRCCEKGRGYCVIWENIYKTNTQNLSPDSNFRRRSTERMLNYTTTESIELLKKKLFACQCCASCSSFGGECCVFFFRQCRYCYVINVSHLFALLSQPFSLAGRCCTYSEL